VKQEAISLPADPAVTIEQLERLVQRERDGRLQAEAIAERGLRELYDSQVRLALLQRITDCANRSDDFSEAIREVLKEICEHMNWAFGTAYRVIGGGTAVSCDAWYAAERGDCFRWSRQPASGHLQAAKVCPGACCAMGTRTGSMRASLPPASAAGRRLRLAGSVRSADFPS